jgi:hypothetical protein
MNYIERQLTIDDLAFLASAYQVIGPFGRSISDDNPRIRDRERQIRGNAGPRYCRECGTDITGRDGNAKTCRPCAYELEMYRKRMQKRKEQARARA